ncbi:MAG: hypothetical protein WD871_07050 [Xanthobacteraceae bacterium]
MTAREQADELQIRCAWVRLRRKVNDAAMRRPSRYLEILGRIAQDEARTLTTIGGSELAAVFWQTLEATNPLDILYPEAASVVLARWARWQKNAAAVRLAPTLDDLAGKRRHDEAKRLMQRAQRKPAKRIKDERAYEVARVSPADN